LSEKARESSSVMNSHSEKQGSKSGNGLNPMATEYKPGQGKSVQQSVCLLPPVQIVDVRPKTSRRFGINIATSQQYSVNKTMTDNSCTGNITASNFSIKGQVVCILCCHWSDYI